MFPGVNFSHLRNIKILAAFSLCTDGNFLSSLMSLNIYSVQGLLAHSVEDLKCMYKAVLYSELSMGAGEAG